MAQKVNPIACLALISKNNSPFYLKSMMEDDPEVSQLELEMMIFA
jgi:hypothetical protein